MRVAVLLLAAAGAVLAKVGSGGWAPPLRRLPQHRRLLPRLQGQGQRRPAKTKGITALSGVKIGLKRIAGRGPALRPQRLPSAHTGRLRRLPQRWAGVVAGAARVWCSGGGGEGDARPGLRACQAGCAGEGLGRRCCAGLDRARWARRRRQLRRPASFSSPGRSASCRPRRGVKIGCRMEKASGVL